MNYVKKYKTVNTEAITSAEESYLDDVLQVLDEFDAIYKPSRFVEYQSMAIEYLMGLGGGVYSTPASADTHLRLICHGKNIHADITAIWWAGQSHISNIEIAIHQNKSSIR